eukprot:GDKI01002050.1.p2 GENE.GDKI01002050.1~~GDKI01002050.1.p2  ORF type:complete len:176 (+),score=41.59 GDKI01002050.1:27-530(+)
MCDMIASNGPHRKIFALTHTRALSCWNPGDYAHWLKYAPRGTIKIDMNTMHTYTVRDGRNDAHTQTHNDTHTQPYFDGFVLPDKIETTSGKIMQLTDEQSLNIYVDTIETFCCGEADGTEPSPTQNSMCGWDEILNPELCCPKNALEQEKKKRHLEKLFGNILFTAP